ncbi:MAG: MoaD/ThiS family protein [Desulfurococcaceae archaeon]
MPVRVLLLPDKRDLLVESGISIKDLLKALELDESDALVIVNNEVVNDTSRKLSEIDDVKVVRVGSGG